MPIATVRSGRGTTSWTTPVRCELAPEIEQIAQHHRTGSEQQGAAQRDLDVVLRVLLIGHKVQQIGAGKRHRHGREHHPADEAQVHSARAQVHGRAERAHHHGRDEVAGDRGRGLHAEEEDQHRRHQCAAAGPGHADEEAHDRAAQDDVWVDVHLPLPPAGAALAAQRGPPGEHGSGRRASRKTCSV